MDMLYELPGQHPLQPGDSIREEIGWPRLYNLRRLHFAAELVLEFTARQLNGVEKIGAHIASDKARLDFAWPESIGPHLAKLAVDVQKIIDEDIHLTSAFSDEPLQGRY
jgi:Ser-tRNA(Ala) deacylase AlaX